MAPTENDVKLFLDSNVILSGLLSPQGAPRILLDLLSIGVPTLHGMTGRYNLDEIERNLRRRFPNLYPIHKEYFPKMRLKIIDIPSYREIEPLLGLMSPKDAPVLASARIGGAHYLITGDKRGFPREVATPIKVISPSDFLSKELARIIESQVSR